MAVLCNTLVAFLIYQSPFPSLSYAFLTPCISAILLLRAITIHVLEDIRGVPSGVLLIYWLVSIISYSVKLFNSFQTNSTAITILYAFLILISISVFLLEYIPFKILIQRQPRQYGTFSSYSSIPQDQNDIESQPSNTPIPSKALLDNADIFSRFAFAWMNPLISKATSGELTPSDLPVVDSNCNSTALASKFLFYWTSRSSDKISQLILALFKSFGGLVLLTGVFEFVTDLLGMAQPFLLRYLILFAQSYYRNDGTPPQAPEIGFYISLGMFSFAMAKTFARTHAFLVNINLMLSVRAALSSVIYKKALRITPAERQQKSTGEIVNLMSTDVIIIVRIFYMISTLWQAPIKLAMCLTGLYHLLGPSAFVGPSLIVAVLPLNSYMTSLLKKKRRKQMKYKDMRIRQTTEFLTNIKSLKLYGWEPPLIDKINFIRNNKQLKNLKKLVVFSSVIDFLWVIIPCIITTSSFAAFAYLENQPLTPDIVFPALSLFFMMNGPILDFPKTLVSSVNSLVSFQRVRDFLVSDELSKKNFECVQPGTINYGDTTVLINNASFGWDHDTPYLKNIYYEACKGELSCIVGKVGCGKTSFLKSLLGELHCQSGSVKIKGNIAYVSQDMWLMNASLRENILFGHKYDERFYNLTIECCALTPDIELLPDGDQTEIGEMGISLSGGQKARVSLARAVYACADIYLLDDPLSAVDEHVAAHVMDKVLSSEGILGTKTRIFATNSIHALQCADTIVLLKDGHITQTGTFSDIMNPNAPDSDIKNLINEFGRHSDDDALQSFETIVTPLEEYDEADENSNSHEDDEVEDNEHIPRHMRFQASHRRTHSSHTLRRASLETLDDSFKGKGDKNKLPPSSHSPSPASTIVETMPLLAPPVKNLPKRTGKTEEKAEQGHVKWQVYKNYIQACNIKAVIITVAVVIISSLDSVTTKFWLKHWSERNSEEGGNVNIKFYLGTYLGIGMTFALLGVARKAVVKIYCGLNASKKLHEEMLQAVAHAPMQFFETTPTGRIINRFSSDIVELDEDLPSNFLEMIWVITDILISVVVIVYGAPMVLFILFPLVGVYAYYQKYYASASRALKRLLVISRSPIYSHFQETLTGSSTIRAFDQVERFEHINAVNLDYNLRAIFLFRGVNRWLSMRQQTIGSILTFATAIFVTYGAITRSISPGLIGVVMGYSAVLSEDISYFIKTAVSLETSIIAVERIMEYCNLKGEAPAVIEETRPEPQWPERGTIEFVDYSTRYRDNLDLILQDISLSIKSQEKVGVVGRTGAGKSSLIMALFRIIEPVEGKIIIDKKNISTLGLADLRSHLSIIPQDSQIFEGTVRQNLDPLSQHSDVELWHALELAHLADFVRTTLSGGQEGLDASLKEGGSNISAGQKQLICLARALLHDSAILVLDEATASVDVATDKLIQETIRKEFKNKTIVTIAHRLNTIMDSDRILVLERGHIAEFDTPANLLANPQSEFYALCKRGGLI